MFMMAYVIKKVNSQYINTCRTIHYKQVFYIDNILVFSVKKNLSGCYEMYRGV